MKRRLLSQLTTNELLEEIRQSDQLEVKEELVRRHTNLVRALAHRFISSGQPYEDLEQVGMLGLLGAIERFDPAVGAKFSTFATTTILGELRRHLRDKAWVIRVPRRLQELSYRMRQVAEKLEQASGRSPRPEELAKALGVSLEELLEAMELGNYYNVGSLELERSDDETVNLTELIGENDPALEVMADRDFFARALLRLGEKERQVVIFRYYQGLSQADVARRLNCSQMHVSRLQRSALKKLKAFFSGQGR